MFQKVLIAEDHNLTHLGLENALRNSSISHVETAQYCDDALLKIRAALHEKAPFELLITDLSFKEDHRDRDISSGEELITQVRELQPDLKIIVFSIENRIGTIKRLFEEHNIDGYVEKGREEAKDIQDAIVAAYGDESFSSSKVTQRLRSANDINEMDPTDVTIINLLARGKSQSEVARNVELSLSSVEKRINKLKDFFNARTPAQLVAIAKDWGVI